MTIVSNKQITKVLRQYNPWWRNPSSIKDETKPKKDLHIMNHLK